MSRALILLVAVAVTELVASVWFAARAPGFERYAALRDPVAQLRREGDVVLVSPSWIGPMVRKALGRKAAPMALPDLRGIDGVVEVSLFGERHDDLAAWRDVETVRVGDFTIRRVENPAPEEIFTDFWAVIDRARVEIHPGVRCMFNPLARPVAGDLGGHPTWPAQRYQCPGPPHVTVGATVIADERWRPRRCILAHPPRTGEISISFRGVRLGRKIIGHGGLYWMTERARRGAPIELRVAVDGEDVGTFIHADGEGWRAFEMDVPPGMHDVSFHVSSPDDEARDFCFEARSG